MTRIVTITLVAAMVLACSTRPVPAAPRLTFVTLYVQNDTDAEAWVTVWPLTERYPPDAFPRGIGVRCYVVEAGSQVVLLDRPPEDGDPAVAAVVAQTHGERQDNDLLVAWLAISDSRDVTTGEGEPTWWPDTPHDCTP